MAVRIEIRMEPIEVINQVVTALVAVRIEIIANTPI